MEYLLEDNITHININEKIISTVECIINVEKGAKSSDRDILDKELFFRIRILFFKDAC